MINCGSQYSDLFGLQFVRSTPRHDMTLYQVSVVIRCKVLVLNCGEAVGESSLHKSRSCGGSRVTCYRAIPPSLIANELNLDVAAELEVVCKALLVLGLWLARNHPLVHLVLCACIIVIRAWYFSLPI